MIRAVAYADTWRFWAGVAYVALALVAVLSFTNARAAQNSANRSLALNQALANSTADSVFGTCVALRATEIRLAHALHHHVVVVSRGTCVTLSNRVRDAIDSQQG